MTSKRELARLAADRPLLTREIHPFNAYYGHDWILKRYAGRPETSVLGASVEHGLTLEDTISDLDRRLLLPTYLTFGSRRARILEHALAGVETIPIGPMIRYASALHAPASEDGVRRLLLLPAHSAQTSVTEFDADAFVAAVRDYGAAFDETVVCLYWKDVLLGRADVYRRHGLRCVTVGHMYDRRFLFRLLDLLRAATAVATNEVGTHVAYAVVTDRPAWIVRQRVDYRHTRGTARDQFAATQAFRNEPPELVSTFERLFAEPGLHVSEAQRQFVAELAGVAHLRSPEDLRAILARAEERYVESVPRRRRARHRATATVRAWRSRLRIPRPD